MSKWVEYGKALYELAVEDGIEKELNDELFDIATIFQKHQDFVKLLSNPRIVLGERITILDHVLKEKIHPYLLSFLKIITEKRDVSITPLVYKEFQKLYYKDKNILLVTVVSAVEITDEQRMKIKEKLERQMKKTILLENKIDSNLIGGIRLEYQGQMIDSSIKNRLLKLQNILKKADYSQVEV
jgi:F-type H+-transporting ATPase subunit delta